MRYTAIILAAGSGKRSGLDFNKILYKIKGKMLIEYSLDFFTNDTNCFEILLIVSNDDYEFCSKRFTNHKVQVVHGGETRRDSVRLALSHSVCNEVIIHDGARPFIPLASFQELLETLKDHDSVTLGVKVKETIQEVAGNKVVKTLDRNDLILTQTPQGFDKEKLVLAHKMALDNDFYGTDDTVLLEKYMGINAIYVNGDYKNIKLTTIEDIKLIEVILS